MKKEGEEGKNARERRGGRDDLALGGGVVELLPDVAEAFLHGVPLLLQRAHLRRKTKTEHI